MLNTKLFTVLRSLDKEELKKFQKFSMSPYHNSNKTITRFLKYVEKYFHVLKGKKPVKRFEKELIFQGIYNGTDFNEGTFAVLRSQALSLLEDFFIFESFRKEKKMQQKFLAESYAKRNIAYEYKRNYLKFEKSNLEEKETDPHWLMHQIDIFLTKMSWHDFDKGKFGHPLLLEVLENLDIFYLHQKMRNETLHANLNTRMKLAIDSSFYKKTIENQLVTYSIKKPVLDFYVRLRDLLYGEKKDMVAIEKFKRDFEKAIDDLNYLDVEIIYFDFQNLVIREYKKKGKSIATVLFDTYLMGIENGIINVQTKMKYTTFYNISLAGSIAGMFEKVDNFIEIFGDKINTADKDSTLILAKAQLLHEKKNKGNWHEIIDLTADFNHSDIKYKCYARSLRVKAFFMFYQEDKTYYYSALSQIRAFKSFLAREKAALEKDGEDGQRLAFWLPKLLVAFNENRTREDILRIFDKIEKDTKLTIFHKEWFLGVKSEMKSLSKKK